MHSNTARRRLLKAGAALAASAMLAGCGFHLRGPQPLAFSTLHVSVSEFSDLGSAIRRKVENSGTTTVTENANERGREILSLTSSGTVREYQLTQRIRFRLIDNKNVELIPPTNISGQREYTFDDEEVLGKEQEEALLYRDMQADLVQQIMRRLAAYRRPQ